MKALIDAFSDKTGMACESHFTSSGQLTAQILEGAPYHLFFAANMKYPEALFQSKKALAPPKVYALGKLVLWTTNLELEPSLKLLQHPNIKHVAIANPSNAPYGIAAMEVLKALNLENDLKEKLVYGESIGQTNLFVQSKSAEMGFTALSVVLSPQLKKQCKWTEINQDLYTPIKQGMVILKSELQKEAQTFYDFLLTPQAQKILIEYGYSLYE